jgi:hypothetical protein
MDLHCKSFIYRSVSMLLSNCSPRNYSMPETLDYGGVAVGWRCDWTRFGLNEVNHAR